MNLKHIESIVELFEKASIHKLVIEEADLSLSLTRGQSVPAVPVVSTPVVSAPVVPSPLLVSLKSTGVGFVKVKVNEGNSIKKGQVAFSITSMNIENDYKAEQDGIVHQIHVDDGGAVEFGQKLIDLNVG